jgi:hypothetical protein
MLPPLSFVCPLYRKDARKRVRPQGEHDQPQTSKKIDAHSPALYAHREIALFAGNK